MVFRENLKRGMPNFCQVLNEVQKSPHAFYLGELTAKIH
jgi:hypothetical protein